MGEIQVAGFRIILINNNDNNINDINNNTINNDAFSNSNAQIKSNQIIYFCRKKNNIYELIFKNHNM